MELKAIQERPKFADWCREGRLHQCGQLSRDRDVRGTLKQLNHLRFLLMINHMNQFPWRMETAPLQFQRHHVGFAVGCIRTSVPTVHLFYRWAPSYVEAMRSKSRRIFLMGSDGHIFPVFLDAGVVQNQQQRRFARPRRTLLSRRTTTSSFLRWTRHQLRLAVVLSLASHR